MDDTPQGACWHCGAALGAYDFGRETNCIACGKPTRVCRNCRWHARGVSNECREPMAERILEKERANYCDFFEPSTEIREGTGPEPGEDLVKKAEDLFNI